MNKVVHFIDIEKSRTLGAKDKQKRRSKGKVFDTHKLIRQIKSVQNKMGKVKKNSSEYKKLQHEYNSLNFVLDKTERSF